MQIVTKIIWILLIIIIFLFVVYIASKIVAIVIRRNLGEISINLNSQTLQSTDGESETQEDNTQESTYEEEIIESFLSNGKGKIYNTKGSKKNVVEGFDNAGKKFKPLDPTVFVDNNDICCLDHEKCKSGDTVVCNYGMTNYAHPYDMSPIDKKIYMLNYSGNFTMQDYVNWLLCFKDKKNELPYNHLKNLNKIEKGEQLIPKNGIVPPPAEIQQELSSEEYFNKLYGDVNVGNIQIYPQMGKGQLLGYNYKEYPAFYQNFQQYGSSDRIYNVKELKKKYPVKLVNNYVQPKLTKF